MIHLDNVSKTYAGQIALAATSKEFRSGAATVLLGPSGCGKSTLLRVILGLVRSDSGTVFIDDQEMTRTSELEMRRRIGYVIQDGGLFPHLTARQNVTLLARHLKQDREQIQKRVGELSELAQLPQGSLDRYPSEMSGGQRQRVGLMRALMLDPPTLLLDEPLGALDPITRNELQQQLKEIFARLRKTVVLVTHDIGEAAYLGDEIVLMRDGGIIQSGTADDLANHPAEPYVTQFLQAQRGAALPGAQTA